MKKSIGLVEKDGQLLHEKVDKAKKELAKAEKELDEYEPPARISKEDKYAAPREHLKLFAKSLDKEHDLCKAAAAMKFFLEYRCHQNKDIESVASQTLKQLEEWNYNNEDHIPLRPWQGLEKMLYFAAAENKIDTVKIKNSKIVQMQLQMLRQKEKHIKYE